jgi:hypothetical protein
MEGHNIHFWAFLVCQLAVAGVAFYSLFCTTNHTLRPYDGCPERPLNNGIYLTSWAIFIFQSIVWRVSAECFKSEYSRLPVGREVQTACPCCNTCF